MPYLLFRASLQRETKRIFRDSPKPSTPTIFGHKWWLISESCNGRTKPLQLHQLSTLYEFTDEQTGIYQFILQTSNPNNPVICTFTVPFQLSFPKSEALSLNRDAEFSGEPEECNSLNVREILESNRKLSFDYEIKQGHLILKSNDSNTSRIMECIDGKAEQILTHSYEELVAVKRSHLIAAIQTRAQVLGAPPLADTYWSNRSYDFLLRQWLRLEGMHSFPLASDENPYLPEDHDENLEDTLPLTTEGAAIEVLPHTAEGTPDDTRTLAPEINPLNTHQRTPRSSSPGASEFAPWRFEGEPPFNLHSYPDGISGPNFY